MNNDHRDVIVHIREGLAGIVYDRPAPSKRAQVRTRTPRTVAVMLGFLGTVAVLVPIILVGLRLPATPRGPETLEGPGAESPSPAGTVEALPGTELLEDAPWRCPPIEPSPDRTLDPRSPGAPSELLFEWPSWAPRLEETWIVRGGEACSRPPSLVLADVGGDGRVLRDVVVWAGFPTPEPSPVTDLALDRAGTVELGLGFVARLTSADDGSVDRIDAVGTIDGLPVWVQGEGVDRRLLVDLIGRMSADPSTGLVDIGDPAPFRVLHSGPASAVPVRSEVLYGTGGVDLEVSRNPGFVTAVAGCRLVDIQGRPGRVCAESYDGSSPRSVRLSWEITPGVVALLAGSDEDLLLRIADDLQSASTAATS